MTIHEFVGIGLSVTAVIIALHTKYQQRQKNKLSDLANRLKELQELLDRTATYLHNPYSHEDLKLELYDVSSEMLACKHETGSDKITIGVTIKTGYGKDSKKLSGSDEIVEMFEKNNRLLVELRVANLDELYARDRQLTLHNPFSEIMYVYDEIDKINSQYGEIINDFDNEILVNLEKQVDEIVQKHSSHLIEHSKFTIHLDEFESTNEIEKAVFEQVYTYVGMNEDFEKLERISEDIEEIRTAVLQTSYS